MIQNNNQQKPRILAKSDILIKTQSQSRWVETVVPLKNNLSFIYLQGGIYELYEIQNKQFVLQGRLPEKIKFFLEIYTKVLLFHDPTDLQIKLLDLNNNQIHSKFAFKSSDKLDMRSEEASRETIIDKYRVFFLDCEEKKIKYLITQDLEKYYSNNNVCHYTIRILPLEWDHQANFDLQPVAKYDYPNSLAQTELYNWQVDQETIAVFGQDNENNKNEILLIKPHLQQKAFYIVHAQYACSYTTMNVTNWINPHQVAVWVNCNDGTTKSSIFTFDLRNYYDGQNWLPEPQFVATLARDEYINDEPANFVDFYQFNLDSTTPIQIRNVNNQARISIINYENIQKPQIINEIVVGDSFWILPSVDRSYILLRTDMAIEDQTIKFSILLPTDAKHQLLQIMEQANIIKQYGISNVEEIFEFYQ